jgi:hypothetical protein
MICRLNAKMGWEAAYSITVFGKNWFLKSKNGIGWLDIFFSFELIAQLAFWGSYKVLDWPNAMKKRYLWL